MKHWRHVHNLDQRHFADIQLNRRVSLQRSAPTLSSVAERTETAQTRVKQPRFQLHAAQEQSYGVPDLGDLAGQEWQKKRTGRASRRSTAARRTDRIPIVEVTAPDGRKSLWAAAVAQDAAVAAVAEVIPANHVATLSTHRLTLNRRLGGLRPGEVRRIKL